MSNPDTTDKCVQPQTPVYSHNQDNMALNTMAVSEMDKMRTEEKTLTDAQRARVERNRQRALLLRQSRLSSRPYTTDGTHRKPNKIGKKPTDTGGGFLVEEDEEGEMEQKIVHPPAPLLGGTQLMCEECDKEFMDSFLYTTFGLSVCDCCRNTEEKHKYITKSEAKEQYLLKDCDIDKREPILKYIVKRNPHNSHWGSMKLYLESQIKERALEVWESEEAMEEARERRTDNKQKVKLKKFDKKMKDLRMSVRGSLWRKKTENHKHVYGEETYNDQDDNYTKTCTTCQHVITYEKM